MNRWGWRFAGMVLLLTVFASPVRAEWLKVASTDQDVFYLGTEESEKFGANIMVWVLRDHVGVRYGTHGAYRSSKDQIEVDCQQRRIRLIYSSDHPEPMGRGKFIHSEHGPMSWNAVDPRSTLNRIVNVACVRR